MSDSVRAAIAKLLMVKAHEENPMLRGMETKEMATLLNVPITTINNALSDQVKTAQYGIFKLTPNRQRYVLWAYSLDVANKANGLPYDSSAGIDPKVQAAEVSKLVEPCVNPDHHIFMKNLDENVEQLVRLAGLSFPSKTLAEIRNYIMSEAFPILLQHYKEQNNEN